MGTKCLVWGLEFRSPDGDVRQGSVRLDRVSAVLTDLGRNSAVAGSATLDVDSADEGRERARTGFTSQCETSSGSEVVRILANAPSFSSMPQWLRSADEHRPDAVGSRSDGEGLAPVDSPPRFHGDTLILESWPREFMPLREPAGAASSCPQFSSLRTLNRGRSRRR
jgi:hypothetical protein